ncbi:MAG TPA: methyltransferase domain-containing protein [Thermoanaerobaculia bacterium]
MNRLAIWRLRRELRRLAGAYWDADSKDESIIASYVAGLARLRAATGTGSPTHAALHLGSGGHRLDGWINADLIPGAETDLVLDIRSGLPFRSATLRWIHSEDVLEHLSQDDARTLIREAFRVLSPGGAMRLVTPDLRAIVEHVYLAAEQRQIRWCTREFGATTPCEDLNMHMRMDGEHRFLYDREQLEHLLRSEGFDVRIVSFGRSSHRELRNLDLRNFGLSLYAEATRPR